MPHGVCEDYAPINDDMIIDEYIESGRADYRTAWYRYLAGAVDDFFYLRY